MTSIPGGRYASNLDVQAYFEHNQVRGIAVEVLSGYRVTRPIETRSRDEQDHIVYHFSVAVIDAKGDRVREFRTSDLDNVRGAFRAIDEMLVWLTNRPEGIFRDQQGSMLKIARRILPRPVLYAIALLLPRYNRPLNPAALRKAIAAELPTGTHKDQIIEFLGSMPAVFCDDLGPRVEAQLLGEAEDQFHTWDILLAFDFDDQKRLRANSVNECLKFF